MNNESCHTCNQPNVNGHKCACGIRCISWSAIFIGAIVAIGLSFLLNVFSASISLSAYHMSADGVKSLAIGGYIGILIGSIAVMFFSGWIAGYLGRGRCVTGCCGGLYGFAAWCVALILMAMFAANLNKFVASANAFIDAPAYSSVAVTTQDAAPVVSTNNAADQVVVNTDKAAMGVFMIFIVFLAAAIASTIGGHYGLRGCCNKSEKCCHTINTSNTP